MDTYFSFLWWVILKKYILMANLNNSRDIIFDNFIPSNPFDLTIGVGFTTETELAGYKNGLIDDLRIYNRALSENEIKELYEMGVK